MSALDVYFYGKKIGTLMEKNSRLSFKYNEDADTPLSVTSLATGSDAGVTGAFSAASNAITQSSMTFGLLIRIFSTKLEVAMLPLLTGTQQQVQTLIILISLYSIANFYQY